MNAKIDIKTPAGKSLEGFPIEGDSEVQVTRLQIKDDGEINIIRNSGLFENERVMKLHPPRRHHHD